MDAIVAVRLLGIAQQSSPKQKTNWVVTVIFVVAVLGIAYWLVFTDSGKAAMAASRRRKEAKKPKAISQVGVKSEAAGLACPKCGGTQFKAARKTSTKLAFGAASMLGQAHFVRCVTCGTRSRRG